MAFLSWENLVGKLRHIVFSPFFASYCGRWSIFESLWLLFLKSAKLRFSYQQSGREERYNQYDPEVAFQGYNATLQPPSISTAATNFSQVIPHF